MENKSEVLFGVKGITGLFPVKEEKGVAHISQIEYKRQNDPISNLRYIRDGVPFMTMYDGTYTRLHINGELMMSDTAMERKTNAEFLRKANGRVMIAGLGLGLIIANIIDKESVTEIVVIEKYQDVIDLVEPKFKNPKLTIICADIMEYIPAKDDKFDTIYFDIWPEISTGNLPEIATLHNRWKFKLNRANKDCWMGSWMQKYLQAKKKKDDKDYYPW